MLLGAAVAAAALAYDPSAPAADAKRFLGLLLAVVLLAISVARPQKPKGVDAGTSPAALFFLAFAAWSGLTLAYGIPLGARDLGTWAAAEVLVLASLRRPVEEARAMAGWAALLAGSGAAAFAVVEAVFWGARGVFVHGGQGNANWLGLLLAVTIPLTLASGARRRVVAASIVLQGAGLWLSHSRVAWAASLITTLPLLLALARPLLARTRGAGAATLAVAAVGIALAASPALAAPPDPIPAAGADVPIPLAWKGRTWIWRTSADAAIASLPAGAGLGGFAHAYLDAQGKRLAKLPSKEASRTFLDATTAHCDWLEVLVDSGPPALLLLALATGTAVLSALRARWLPGAAAIGAFAVCAMGDSPLRQPGLVLVLALAIGACPRTLLLASDGPRPILTAARVALLAACALLLAQATRGWIADRRLTAARDAAPADQRALLASAAHLDPTSGEIALERGLRELDQDHPEIALRELHRSRPLLASIAADIAIGNAEVQLGHPEIALPAYMRALARHPGSFRAHANISQPLLALGHLDEAEQHLTIAAELWPGHPHLMEMIDRLHQAKIDREAP